jgi:diguanylate cyclase (GGDEF)-like protein/PAS domain S-box-containing protein
MSGLLRWRGIVLLKSNRRGAWLVLLLAVLALTTGAYRWKVLRQEPLILRVGYNSYPPYLLPQSTGPPKGLAVAVMTEAARRAQVQLSWILISSTPEVALKNGQIDLFPLLAVTDVRKRDFAVSEPWWQNETVLVSLKSRAIMDGTGMAGKSVAVRGFPALLSLSKRLFPRSRTVIIPEIDRMMTAVCEGEVDSFFLDQQLLELQLAEGTRACSERPLHIASVPNSSLALATMASNRKLGIARRIFYQLQQLSGDGSLADISAHFSLHNPYAALRVREGLNAKYRSDLGKYGFSALALVLLVVSIQNLRIRRARKAEEESQGRFDAFMKYSPAIQIVKHRDGRLLYVNEAYYRTFNKTSEEVLGKTNSEIWPPDVAEELRHTDEAASSSKQEWIQTLPSMAGSRDFLVLKFPILHSNESWTGVVALDITEKRVAERALRFSQFSIENAMEAVTWLDSEGRIIYANGSAATRLGYTREELLTMTVLDISPGDSMEHFIEGQRRLKTEGSQTFESHHKTRDGSLVPVEVTVNYLEFEGREFTCCISRDIRERKLAEIQLAYQAERDPITGLPNRWSIERHLEEAVGRATAHKGDIAVLFLDLDGFKFINDTLGHSTGDQLLRKVAVRLQNLLPPAATFGRMGGDEFVITLEGMDLSKVEAVAGELHSALQKPFEGEGRDFMVTASIGISIFPGDGRSATTLLQTSDSAMYQAKSSGGNEIQFYTSELGSMAKERLYIETGLRRAIEQGTLRTVYQPQVSVATGEIVGYEALLRWNDSVFGQIPPSKFIPIAEQTGLIVPIGTWVLEQACREAARWSSEGWPDVAVAVNVSAVQFRRPDFITTVEDVLRRTGLPPRLLDLELTESVVLNGIDEVAQKIRALRSLGIRISLDDFGTGYSSLSYLQKLPINALKIDRSFIRDIVVSSDARAVTRALISLAHSLRLDVVAEGVESQQQLDSICKIGCDLVQGYLFGQPVEFISGSVSRRICIDAVVAA